MSACPRCGTERTLSGYCGAQGAWEVCRLRAELRAVKARLAAAEALDKAAEMAIVDIALATRGDATVGASLQALSAARAAWEAAR